MSSPDGRFLAHTKPHSVLVLDRWHPQVVGCLDSGSRLPFIERARPLNLLLTVWCGDRNMHAIHAGLVARDGHGVLLAGSAEAGKSTAALACACAGFDFLADDCVALAEPEPREFEGHSLYASATVDSAHLPRFTMLPVDAGERAVHNGAKSLLFVGEAPPLRAGRVAPIRALALPRIVGSADPRACRASKREALQRLAPGTIATRAVPAQSCLSRLARLVDRVPSYWLDLDHDVAAIPRRVERLMADTALP